MQGGLRYALLKRHYDCDDYVSLESDGVMLINGITFTATPTFYISGLMAYLNDTTVPNLERGWSLFTHGQPAWPVWLAPFMAAAGIAWPVQVPAFEAKDTLFYSTEDCWIWFEGSSRVRHFIPANTYFRYHRRWFIMWVVRSTTSGILRAHIEG